MMMKRIVLFFTGFFLFVALAAPNLAHADLTISPLRVIYEGRDRSAEVNLLNLSDKEKTYRIGWKYNKMNQDGAYDPIPASLTPDFDVANLVVFSPRQVTLPPQGRQKIRLSLRRPPNFPDGEYRAHLVFQRLPIGEQPKLQNAPEKGVTLAVNVMLGFSIPVVVRQGEYQVQAEITQPRFIPANQTKDGKSRIAFAINRSGLHSTIGRVTVHWDGSDHPDKRIGLLNNVSIFPEMTYRNVEVMLNRNTIPSGIITIRYQGEGPQKGEILAEKSFPVGG